MMKERPMQHLNEKYASAIRVLHWLMAIAIVGMLILGFVVANIPKTEMTRHLYMGLHKSIGLTLLAFIVLRVALRFSTAAPPLPKAIPSIQRAFAYAAHFVLYALMFLIPVSGYVMSVSMGQPVRWFGIDVPRLFAEDRVRGLMAGNVHAIADYVLIAVLVLHIGAVAWHYVFERVNLMRRVV